MAEGELMMTIPLDLCLTRAVAQETFGMNVIPEYMDEYIAIAILLMTERLKGNIPYIFTYYYISYILQLKLP